MKNKLNFHKVLCTTFKSPKDYLLDLIRDEYGEDIWMHVYNEVSSQLFSQVEQCSELIYRESIDFS
jgi:hypothetical protein